jgi:hypothetical protein
MYKRRTGEADDRCPAPPQFAQLDAPSRGEDGCSLPEEDASSRAVVAVQLLGAVLEDSPSNRQSMVAISGAAWACVSRASIKHLGS